MMRHVLLGPQCADDCQILIEALAALAVGDPVGLVGAWKAAAADAEDQPAMADLIDRRGLFGEPQRMA